MNGQTMYLLEC